MDIPTQTKPAIWGAVAGAIATLILGFYFGGWQTSRSAEQLANERSEKKVIAALAPFCVDRFRKSADAQQSAELLKFTTDYERGSFLEKGGWTTLPGSTEPNWAVGRACGNLLAAAAKK
jgi:alpha/beta superfamily hydrolase